MERTKLLILRITNRCNLSCRYCYAQESHPCSHQKQIDMTFSTAKKAIDLLAKPGGKLKIQFTGGEPLLCIGLMQEVSEYVQQMKIQTDFSVQTNGTLLSEKNCRLLKQMRCAVGVSLDGMGEANALRIYPDQKAAFGDTIEGIQRLGQVGMACNVNAVISRKNQSGLPKLLELVAYLGNVKGIGLDMFRPLGRGAEEDFAPRTETLPKDLIAMLEKQKQLETLGVRIRIKESEKVRRMLSTQQRETCYCYAQTKDSIAVDPYGEIYPCSSFVGRKEMCMGNIEDTSVENDHEKEGFVLCWPKVPGMDQGCFTCDVHEICRGGCPAGRIACAGRNQTDCIMHRTIIDYERKKYG